jgi:serine protease Do
VIVDVEGYIVTNNHVVAGATEIWVQLIDGREVPADIVGADVLTDLAVLKIDEPNLIALPWGDSEAMEAGDMIWAVGSPFGLQRSVSFGIVSAKSRHMNGAATEQDFLQTDAAVNPGNSGGPLVNIRGNIVGINTAIVGTTYRGISFAIPSAVAEDIYERLKTNRKIARGRLGVMLGELTSELGERFGIESPRGVLVVGVLRDSPAERARIEVGDVIIEWKGERVDDPTTLSRMVAATEVGSRAELKLIRDGVEMNLEVEVDERLE